MGHRRPRPRGLLVVGSLLLLLVVLAAVWVGVRGALAARELMAAESLAQELPAVFSDTDTATASELASTLSGHTSAARSLTGDPIWSIAQELPWLGPQLAAISQLAVSADELVTGALEPVLTVTARRSADSAGPGANGFDLSAASALAPTVRVAADRVEGARAGLARVDRIALVVPLRELVDSAAALLEEFGSATSTLADALELLPPMLGEDSPRTYLVLIQNNAELRSLGGIVGQVAFVTVDRGVVTLEGIESGSSFGYFDVPAVTLSAQEQALFSTRPARYMLNTTQMTDFSQAATIAREMWARTHEGQEVDGVVAVDPVVLAHLLDETGEIVVPGYGTVSGDTVVADLLSEAYARYADPADQDEYFAAVARAVFDALPTAAVSDDGVLRALASSARERRVLVWSAHEEEQRTLATTSLAGGLPRSTADQATFGVYLNDGTGSKMDYHLDVEVALDWTGCVQPDDPTASLTLTLTNTAPDDAAQSLPAYVTGGGASGVPAGMSRTVAYVYLPEGFDLVDAITSDGSGTGGGEHEGLQALTVSVDLEPGATFAATFAVRSTHVWPSRLVAQSTPTYATDNATSLELSCGAQ